MKFSMTGQEKGDRNLYVEKEFIIILRLIKQDLEM